MSKKPGKPVVDRDEIFRRVSGKSSDSIPSDIDLTANSGQEPTLSDKVEFEKMTVRIDKRQRARLEVIARKEGRLLSEVVREAIRDYLRD